MAGLFYALCALTASFVLGFCGERTIEVGTDCCFGAVSASSG